MWVKFCANTNLDDALRAVELGADAVGFVFAPSKRQVTPAQVAEITTLLPLDVERVGVFTDHTPQAIADAVRQASLTAVQLHGGVEVERATELRTLLGPDIPLIHTVAWVIGDDDASADDVRHQLNMLTAGDRVLIDAKYGAVSGGLGLSFDWQRAAGVLSEFPSLRIIVAGGLRPENVAEAIATLKPYGVDVASGVERAPGQKDPEKLESFIRNARRA